MARKRRIPAHERPLLVCLDGARPDSDGKLLTRAEAKAIRAGASRTHRELTQHLQVVRDRPFHSV